MIKRGLAAIAIAIAAFAGLSTPASAQASAQASEQVSAQGWVYIGTYNWGFCNWLGKQYTDGSTGYECWYNKHVLLYDLYVGP